MLIPEHIHAAMDSHHMISHKTALQEFLDRSEENLTKVGLNNMAYVTLVVIICTTILVPF